MGPGVIMLVNCVVYEPGARLADIPVRDIHKHLAKPGCFVWVALKDPEPSELERLQEEFGLHHLAGEDVHVRITEKTETIEERIFAGDTSRAQIEALYTLKRKLLVLDHATGPLLEVAGKLHGGRAPPICAGLHDYFRDVYDHLLRLKQSIDNLRDMVTTAASLNLSLITISESEATKRLAAYAAPVEAPTMIAGTYGMNFDHMPELEWVWGSPVALGSMVAIDLYLVHRFRAARWM